MITVEDFPALLAEWRAAAVRHAMRLTGGDEALSQDLVQDASVKLWVKLGDGRIVAESGDHFRALLLLLTRWEWHHHVGAVRARFESLLDEVDEGQFTSMADRVDQAPSAESTVMWWLGGPAVAALREVRPPGQSILVKKIIAGYTAAEIAAEFGHSSESAARHAIHAARQELRAAYAAAQGVPVPTGRRSAPGCTAGHGWTPENTEIRPDGKRRCRACRQRYIREWKQSERNREYNRDYQREYMRKKRREAELTHKIDPDDLLRIVHHA